MPKKRKNRPRKNKALRFLLKGTIVLGIVLLLFMAIVGRMLKYNRYFWHPHSAKVDTVEKHGLWRTYEVGGTSYINTPSGSVSNNGDGIARAEEGVTQGDYSEACKITGWRPEHSP